VTLHANVCSESQLLRFAVDEPIPDLLHHKPVIGLMIMLCLARSSPSSPPKHENYAKIVYES
jgi:hypothetical protein